MFPLSLRNYRAHGELKMNQHIVNTKFSWRHASTKLLGEAAGLAWWSISIPHYNAGPILNSGVGWTEEWIGFVRACVVQEYCVNMVLTVSILRPVMCDCDSKCRQIHEYFYSGEYKEINAVRYKIRKTNAVRVAVKQCELLFVGGPQLTHWGRDEIDAISQTTFSKAFFLMKMYWFRLTFHWNLFPRVQLTIFQHWFR